MLFVSVCVCVSFLVVERRRRQQQLAGMASAVGRVCGRGSSGNAAAARAGVSGKGLRRQQVKVWSARVTRRRTGARAAPEGEEDGGGVGSSGDGAGKGVEVPDEVAEFAEVGVDGSWLNSIVKETKLIDWPSRNEVRLRNTWPSRDSCRALDAPSPCGNQLETDDSSRPLPSRSFSSSLSAGNMIMVACSRACVHARHARAGGANNGCRFYSDRERRGSSAHAQHGAHIVQLSVLLPSAVVAAGRVLTLCVRQVPCREAS